MYAIVPLADEFKAHVCAIIERANAADGLAVTLNKIRLMSDLGVSDQGDRFRFECYLRRWMSERPEDVSVNEWTDLFWKAVERLEYVMPKSLCYSDIVDVAFPPDPSERIAEEEAEALHGDDFQVGLLRLSASM